MEPRKEVRIFIHEIGLYAAAAGLAVGSLTWICGPRYYYDSADGPKGLGADSDCAGIPELSHRSLRITEDSIIIHACRNKIRPLSTERNTFPSPQSDGILAVIAHVVIATMKTMGGSVVQRGRFFRTR